MRRIFYYAARRGLYAFRAWREYLRPVGPFFFKNIRLEDLEISPVREQDIPLLERFLPSKHAGKHRDRLAAQKEGKAEYLIARYGIPVGYVYTIWKAGDAVRLEELPPLPERAVYQEDLYIHPAARGAGVGGLLWKTARRRVQEKGHSAILATVMLTNPAMEATHSRLGYRRVDDKVHEYRAEYTDASGRKRAWSTRVKYFILEF